MNYLNHLIETSAHKWNVSIRTAKIAFWAPIIATLLVLVLAALSTVFDTSIFRDIFRFLLEEDGPAEWVSAFGFGASGVIGLGIAFYRLRSKHLLQAILFFGFAAVMIFAAGEEISWGQRIFGWDTPGELLEINDQGETTLHNIGFLLDITNLAMLLTGLYGSGAYIVNQSVQIQQHWEDADYLFIPPFFLASYFIFIFLFRALRLVIVTDSNFTLNRMAEWVEAVVALGIIGFIWLAYRYVSSRVNVTTPPVPVTES